MYVYFFRTELYIFAILLSLSHTVYLWSTNSNFISKADSNRDLYSLTETRPDTTLLDNSYLFTSIIFMPLLRPRL